MGDKRTIYQDTQAHSKNHKQLISSTPRLHSQVPPLSLKISYTKNTQAKLYQNELR